MAPSNDKMHISGVCPMVLCGICGTTLWMTPYMHEQRERERETVSLYFTVYMCI